MHSSSLLTAVFALSASVSALALPNLFRRDTLTVSLPPSSLPAPSSISPAVTLKYISLGVGTQNYTCAATPKSASGAPVAVGAKAILYDAGPFLQKHSEMIGTLPSLALGYQTLSGRDVCPLLGIPQIGKHFFNAAGSPTFDLTSVGARLIAKKLNSVAAPADACPGPQDAGAVDWLQLTDNGTGQSFGDLTYVYRVETAGGKAPATCVDQKGTFQVSYATEYWFYGP
jgi:hypothetical protein